MNDWLSTKNIGFARFVYYIGHKLDDFDTFFKKTRGEKEVGWEKNC